MKNKSIAVLTTVTYISGLLISIAAVADPPANFPQENCMGGGPKSTCVDFADNPKEEGSIWLSSTPQILLLQGTANRTDIWDSHGLITLTAVTQPNSKCASSATDTWIQEGTRVMIQTRAKNQQELFLLAPSGGKFAEFDLMPGRPPNTADIVWMTSPTKGILGPGANTYDYFVEFGTDATHPLAKHFRFDAFPHWNTPPTTGNDLKCYQERPDQRNKDWAITSTFGPTETSTGTGNEPVH